MRVLLVLLTALTLLLVATTASADLTGIKDAARETIGAPGSRGATGFCSILYYNMCSGWLWTWSGWGQGDEVGVVFDLPADCGHHPGDPCENTHLWWYWRYTMNGWRDPVTFHMYEADESGCIVGESVAEYACLPVERWNYLPGLGSCPSDRIIITASWDWGVLPRLVTDNAIHNHMAGCAPEPIEVRSFYYGRPWATRYCPPLTLEDSYGPCNILMSAGFDCQTTAVENASWGAVKSLFK